ncbi:hypothetical protein RHO15_06000 [Utexia brackfieldae]|uniref:hypothetical protein n=1 Tax=Utexia brackfieldae TaxID=3074108 RepID=UPI00370D3014
MKNLIFLCCLASITLVSCNKKVYRFTDESLAGQWSCNRIEYQASWVNNKFADYVQTSNVTKGQLIFKYENNQLFALKNSQWIKGSILTEYNNLPIVEDDGRSIRIKNEYLENQTKNTVNLVEEHTYLIKDTRYNKLNSKSKLVIACIKIASK